MQHSPSENYAHQCDPVQPKTRAPRPKKEVHKPDPKKIFDGIIPAKVPKPTAKKPKVRRRKKRTDKTR